MYQHADPKLIHPCFAVLSQRDEFADAVEAMLSDLALSNGTMMSPAEIASLEPADDGVFDKLGVAVGVDWMGDSGRNFDCCWLGEAMV